MAQGQTPLPVKYFCAILYRDHSAFKRALELLYTICGEADFYGKDHLFDVTDYYAPEMGSPLYRKQVSFEPLRGPTELPHVKIECNRIESELAFNRNRTVNLDCGYLDHNKFLLASAKEAGQKIYLDKGIYADLAGRYKNGKYQPFEWSFPDFRDGRYDAELLEMRRRYLFQLKAYRKGHSV